ncbi:MAG TPA: alpha/beta hydrolase [Thermoanaerobaculia bacterium]|jgi:pimeloyl-ACP methyl ester carboxylesterase|nr:alpha/beta hydrolase [Thermoanaerobaculia bacterium]
MFTLAALLFAANLVDVGGRKLHLECTGGGSPTVIFESGLGEGYYVWSRVQPEVAKTHRACSYDRAGLGFSDPSPTARSIASLIDDLHLLLSKSGEQPPYVLVGHSLGGLLVRRYAARFPDEVTALVLVDSAHEEGESITPPELAAVQAARRAQRAEQLRSWHASGKFEEMGFPSTVTGDLLTQLRRRSATAAWWDARFAENTLPDMRTPTPITVPTIVITATRWPLPNGFPAPAWTRYTAARLDLQKELAARSPHGTQIVVDSGHEVPTEHPEVVIGAVGRVGQ